MVKLYGYFRSSASFRVRIALNLKNLPYEPVFIHLRKSEQRRPEYLEINPTGLVPSLEDDGQVFIQSLAIIEYLDETHPEPPLLPGHPADRARVRALANIVACDIHPIDNLRVLRYLSRNLGQDEAGIQRWFDHWIVEGFNALERIMADDGQTGEFCHGDEPGLADVCLVPQVVNAQRYKLDMTPYPAIRRVFENCMKIDAFDRAHPSKQPDYEA
jgi:maleylacetoacetate isomerase